MAKGRTITIAVTGVLVLALIATLWMILPLGMSGRGSGATGKTDPPRATSSAADQAPTAATPAKTVEPVEGEQEEVSEKTDVVEGLVSADGLLLEHPEGAVLDVEPGDLPVGTTVRLSTTTTPRSSLIEDLQPDGVVWSIEADSEPEDFVSFIVPFDPGLVPEDAVPYVATYDELTRMWLPGRTDVDGDVLRTELPSFSLKTWILDRVGDGVESMTWVEYQLFRLTGSRAEQPSCSPRPEWVREVHVVDNPNAQLFACVEGHGDGFAIRASNNRGYPVALELSMPFTSAEPGRVEADVQGLRTLVAHLVATSGQQRVPLGPTETGLVVFDPLDAEFGMVQGHVRRDALSMVMFLTIEMARKVGVDLPVPGGKTLGLWNLECFGKVVNAGRDLAEADMARAGGQLTGCMTTALEHEVRQWGLVPNGRLLWTKQDLTAYPPGVSKMVGGLRFLWALEVTRWATVAGDLIINDATAEADLVDVSVRWAEAPKWGAGGEGGVWLHTLPAEADAVGDSGHQVPATLEGRNLPQSTAAWVGCSGRPATLTYQLDGNYRQLVTVLGLAEHTPEGVDTEFTVEADGRTLTSQRVDGSDAAELVVDVTGVDELVIGAQAVRGTCDASPTPYGVLGDAYLVPVDPEARDRAPQALLGTWSGEMTQPSSPRSPYSMDVVFTGGAIGQQVARVRYDDLDCSGVWHLTQASSADEIIVRETIQHGRANCMDVDLTVSSNGETLTVTGEGVRVWADLPRVN